MPLNFRRIVPPPRMPFPARAYVPGTPPPVYRPQARKTANRPETAPPVYRPEAAGIQPKTAYRPGTAPPVYCPQNTPIQLRPAAVPLHAPPVYRPQAAGVQPIRPRRAGIAPPPYRPSAAAQRKFAPVIQRAAAPLTDDQLIRQQQAIVTASKQIIGQHTHKVGGQRRIKVGLTYGQLGSLIQALNESIDAREQVHAAYGRLGQEDPGDHETAIAVDQGLLQAANDERDTLNHHDATAWQQDPQNPNRQIRTGAYWDRDEIRQESRWRPGYQPPPPPVAVSNPFDLLGDA